MGKNMRTKVLAVASGGGHWVQLLCLRPAFEEHDVVYVTVQADYIEEVVDSRFYKVTDATRWSRWSLAKMVAEICYIIIRERPDIVISTGSAPGAAALRIGKWLGAKTIWIDSIANIQEISMSGYKVRKYSDLWLTQWEHLARSEGPRYLGSIL